MRRVRYYIRLLFAFMRISLLSQMEYRLNFVTGFCIEAAYMVIKLTYLFVVMRAGVNIGVLTPDMIMLFIGVYCIMTGVWCFLWGISEMPGKVISGAMDMLIVKPGSLQFMQSFGRFDFALAVPNFTVGIILVIVAWRRVGISVSLITVGGFLFFLLMGVALTYSFILMQALLVFWVTSTGGILTLFSALWDFNNMPMALYGRTIQLIGTFIIPIFMLTNWAGMFALDQLSRLDVAWGIGLPIIMLTLTRIMWKRGMRRYTSAGG